MPENCKGEHFLQAQTIFVSNTITSSHLNEYYGFVQSEVDKILEDAGIKGKKEVIKKWYDGYHFGDADVYCPWDVMCYIDDLQKNSNAEPDEYWKDTSDNAIIRSFIDYAGTSITKKMENADERRIYRTESG